MSDWHGKYQRSQGAQTRDAIFKYLIDFKFNNDGLSPTIRDIMEACGLRSSSQVSYHLRALQQMGRLSLRRQGIVISGGKWIY